MEPFIEHTGVAAPLDMINVDTDMIIPKQFLKTIKRTGLGVNLFDEMRYLENGNENSDFILNQKGFRQASILLAGHNFGCGSSREHAPWALLDFGIKCVIAPSYADIFYSNCFKNGILPVVLPEDVVKKMMEQTKEGANVRFSIDLEKQKVVDGNGEEYDFDIDEFKKHCLLNGLDDIALTLEKKSEIDRFENQMGDRQPWVSLQNNKQQTSAGA